MDRAEIIRRLDSGVEFRFERDLVEATYGGLFGGEPDTCKVYVPGMVHYYLGDESLTDEEASVVYGWYLEKENRHG